MVALKAIGVYSTRSKVFFRRPIHSSLPFFLVAKLSRILQSQLAPEARACMEDVGP